MRRSNQRCPRSPAHAGFPCNQFGGQEPGTEEEVEKFACGKYKVTFPLMAKVDVNGEGAAPLFKFIQSEQGGVGSFLLGRGYKWNFEKVLVDRHGKVVERYAPTTSPASLEKDIEKLL
jgi:glutathione peroxidase